MLATLPTDMPPLPLLLLGAGILFAAGLLRGFTGYGFSIAAVPLLSLICRPPVAVPIVLILQLLVSVNGLPGAVRGCDWRSVRLLAVAALAATPFGVLALTSLSDTAVQLFMAAIVAVAVVALGRGLLPSRSSGERWALAFGGVAGFFNGLAGMPGPPIIAYYLASSVGSATARASMIVLFLPTSLVALASLAVAGSLTAGGCALALGAFPAVWAGSWAGARLYRTSPEWAYRWTGIIVLGATALATAARAVAALG